MGDRKAQTETITINSYQKVWGYEKMLYQITNNITLPRPIVASDFYYFLTCVAMIALVQFLFRLPVPSFYVGLLIYIGVPLGTTAILRYKSFDGKNPMVFTIDYLRFLLVERKKETEFFLLVNDPSEQAVAWRIGYRHRLRRRVAAPERK